MADDDDDDKKKDKSKAANDAYTGMLLISLVALVVGSLLLYLDFAQYPDKAPPKLDRMAKSPPPEKPEVEEKEKKEKVEDKEKKEKVEDKEKKVEDKEKKEKDEDKEKKVEEKEKKEKADEKEKKVEEKEKKEKADEKEKKEKADEKEKKADEKDKKGALPDGLRWRELARAEDTPTISALESRRWLDLPDARRLRSFGPTTA